MARYMSIQSVIDLLRAQIQGIKSRPGVAEGLPRPLAVLEADLARIEAAEKARATAERIAIAATEEVQRAAFTGRSSARANLIAVQKTRGKYSPDLTLLGGKARHDGRRTPDEAVESPVEEAGDSVESKVA